MLWRIVPNQRELSTSTCNYYLREHKLPECVQNKMVDCINFIFKRNARTAQVFGIIVFIASDKQKRLEDPHFDL